MRFQRDDEKETKSVFLIQLNLASGAAEGLDLCLVLGIAILSFLRYVKNEVCFDCAHT